MLSVHSLLFLRPTAAKDGSAGKCDRLEEEAPKHSVARSVPGNISWMGSSVTGNIRSLVCGRVACKEIHLWGDLVRMENQ